MEDIKTQFIGIGCDIIDINEKCSKMHTKDIDALFTNVIQLNKKNALLKKIYDLEENISKMRVAITKATLSGVANTVIVPETTTGGKVIAEEPIIAETTATETTTDVDPVEDKSSKKTKSKKKEEVVETPKPNKKKEEVVETPKSSKKKEEVVEPPKETAVETPKPSKKKEETSKSTKKKKEEEVSVVKEPVVEIVSTDTAVTKQPVQEVATASEEGEQQLHLKRKKIPHHIRTYVWNEYIGPDVAQSKCLCCKKEDIRIRNFHCGHVIAESKGGDLTIKNLRPICSACNISMGTMSMNEFTKTFFGWEV